MSKAIVLENGFEQDIPDSLIQYLDKNKIEWVLFDMRERFWKENKSETVKFFSNLPEGQVLLCHTVFDGFQQLELMIELLFALKHKKFTFKIMHGCLSEDLIEFYENEESSITPKEIEAELEKGDLSDAECDAIYEKSYAFKKQMNEKFLEVLKCHNIYWIGWEEFLFKDLQDIKNANE
jgi:hypothetical protein